MDLVINILKQLGTNETFLNQLVIILVIFVISKFLFIGRLQNIIESREGKTVGLEEDSEKKFEEVNRLNDQYKQRIQEANREAKTMIDNSKTEIIKSGEKKYREEETEVSSFVEKSKKEIELEIKNKEEEIMKEAEVLSSSLIQKITKG